MTKSLRYALAITIGVSALTGWSAKQSDIPQAQAVEISSQNTIATPLASVPSILAAAAMSAEGASIPGTYISYPLSAILSRCQLHSHGEMRWFSGCNPIGMRDTLADYYPAQTWKYQDSTGMTSAGVKLDMLKLAANMLVTNRMPILFPLHGRGDHWVTVWKVDVALDAVTNRVSDIYHFWFNDGVLTEDAIGNPSWLSAVLDGSDFADVYDKMTVVGPYCKICKPRSACPLCSDPYLEKFMFLYDPPLRSPFRRPEPAPSADLGQQASTTLSADEPLTLELAQARVRDAVLAAGLMRDGTLAERMLAGQAVGAYEVYVRSSGPEPRRRVIVPMVRRGSEPSEALAFVGLDGQTGAVRSVSLPSPGFVYLPVSAETAATTARKFLRPDESLGPPALIADPMLGHPGARHAFQALYEFPIRRQADSTEEVVRILHNGGQALGRAYLD